MVSPVGNLNRIPTITFVLMIVYFHFGYCFPCFPIEVSEIDLEDIDEDTASMLYVDKVQNREESDQREALKNVKSLMPGEMMMWESDERRAKEASYGQGKQLSKEEKEQQCKTQQDSAPRMVVVHTVDMVAMDIPLQDVIKDAKPKKVHKDQRKVSESENPSNGETCERGISKINLRPKLLRYREQYPHLGPY